MFFFIIYSRSRVPKTSNSIKTRYIKITSRTNMLQNISSIAKVHWLQWLTYSAENNLCLHSLLSTMTETSCASSNKTILFEVIYLTEGRWIDESVCSICLSFAWQRCRSISALCDMAYVAVISTISYHYSKEKYPAMSLIELHIRVHNTRI